MQLTYAEQIFLMVVAILGFFVKYSSITDLSYFDSLEGL